MFGPSASDRLSAPSVEISVSIMILRLLARRKRWPGCANECFRSHGSSDVEVDVDVDVDVQLLTPGAQKLRSAAHP